MFDSLWLHTVHGILQARILEWVTFPFSRGSSHPMNRTQVSHIAGRLFTSWATREAQKLSVQFSSVTQSCPTLCNPMDCSMPGFPVHHQLPELAQTHVHLVGDAIQQPHPLSSPSAFILFQCQSLSNDSVLCIRWPKYWSFSFSISPSNDYSGLISFRTD